MKFSVFAILLIIEPFILQQVIVQNERYQENFYITYLQRIIFDPIVAVKYLRKKKLDSSLISCL